MAPFRAVGKRTPLRFPAAGTGRSRAPRGAEQSRAGAEAAGAEALPAPAEPWEVASAALWGFLTAALMWERRLTSPPAL